MPARSPDVSDHTHEALRAIGAALRTRRKALGLSSAIAAESAGMSRVTLYRIETGEASVTIGAYMNAATTLGLQLSLADLTPQQCEQRPTVNAAPDMQRIRIDQYPQLRAVAWQLREGTEITRAEALSLYERNWRHVDKNALTDPERLFIKNLADEFDGGLLDV